MNTIVRGLEGLLGAFFLVTAAMKAVDMDAFALQISLYRVLSDPGLVRAAAYGAVTVEAVLGALLLGGWRLKGFSHGAAVALTLIFSGLIAYAWVYHDLEDCGCFGSAIQMGPAASLMKNGALLLLLGASWWGTRGAAPTRNSILAATRGLGVAAVAGVVAVSATVGAAGKPEAGQTARETPGTADAGPYAGYRFEDAGESVDLSGGAYLVAMLSATCEHCQSIVPELNDLYLEPGLPRLVALMLGSADELEVFDQLTAPLFPKTLIPSLEFSQLVGTPPILVYVVDGVPKAEWNWDEAGPDAESIRAQLLDAPSP